MEHEGEADMSESYTEIARGIVNSIDGSIEIAIGVDRARERTMVSESPAEPLPRSRPSFKYGSLADWHRARARELSEESGLSLEITSLLLSAEHHLEMYGRPPKFREYGPSKCPCCSLYLNSDKGQCGGCPIRHFTGEKQCKRTPYMHMITDLHYAVNTPLKHKNEQVQRADRTAAMEYKFLAQLALYLAGLDAPPSLV
jgi:hypothetical protein